MSTLLTRSGRKSISIATVFSRHSAALALIVLVVVNMFVTPGFATATTLWNVVIQATPLMLVALGITLTVATGGIDLTVGSVMAVGAATAAVVGSTYGTTVGVVAGVAVAAGIGLINGTLIHHLKIQPLILTLAGLLALRGVAQVIAGGRVTPMRDSWLVSLTSWRLFGIVPSQVFIMLGAVAVVFFVVKRTTLGVYVEAMGDNPRAAIMAGVPARRVLPLVYLSSAILAALAGLTQAGRLSAADPINIGDAIHLDAIAAIAIGGANLLGGRPNVSGTALGVLVIQLIDVMLTMNDVSYVYSLVAKAVIIVAAVYFQLARRDS